LLRSSIRRRGVCAADPAAIEKGEPERGEEGADDAEEASLRVGSDLGASRPEAGAAAAAAATAADAAASACPAAVPRTDTCIVVSAEHRPQLSRRPSKAATVVARWLAWQEAALDLQARLSPQVEKTGWCRLLVAVTGLPREGVFKAAQKR